MHTQTRDGRWNSSGLKSFMGIEFNKRMPPPALARAGRGAAGRCKFRRALRRTFYSTWRSRPGRRAPRHATTAAPVFAQLALRWGRNWAAQWHLARAVGNRFRVLGVPRKAPLCLWHGYKQRRHPISERFTVGSTRRQRPGPSSRSKSGAALRLTIMLVVFNGPSWSLKHTDAGYNDLN